MRREEEAVKASFFIARKPIQNFGFGFVVMDSRSRNPKNSLALEGFPSGNAQRIQACGLLGLNQASDERRILDKEPTTA
jgi:hypothetical protein